MREVVLASSTEVGRYATAATASLAAIVCGMACWVLWYYTKKVYVVYTSDDRRSGLLPLHVMFVTSYAIMSTVRSVLRDFYHPHDPTWLTWPATMFLTAWLGLAMLALVAMYVGRGRNNPLRHPPE